MRKLLCMTIQLYKSLAASSVMYTPICATCLYLDEFYEKNEKRWLWWF